MKSRPIFVGGTSSNAGKSFMATAICAWLRSQGLSVAPFKAQNMSNNSFPAVDGGEIGRAQVVQARACGLEPTTAMNPILLKPNGDGTSQVVVRGRVWKTLSARRYYEHFDVLQHEVLAAYEELARQFDVVVIEGAGSVSELNLRDHDLVNLGLVTLYRGAVGARGRHRARRCLCVRHRHGIVADQGNGVCSAGFSSTSFAATSRSSKRAPRCWNQRQGFPAWAFFLLPPTFASMPKTASRSMLVPRRGSTGSPNRHRPLSVDFQRDRFSTVALGRMDMMRPQAAISIS